MAAPIPTPLAAQCPAASPALGVQLAVGELAGTPPLWRGGPAWKTQEGELGRGLETWNGVGAGTGMPLLAPESLWEVS